MVAGLQHERNFIRFGYNSLVAQISASLPFTDLRRNVRMLAQLNGISHSPSILLCHLGRDDKNSGAQNDAYATGPPIIKVAGDKGQD